MGKLRTTWDLTLTLAIPFSRWGAQPFIVHPIAFPPALVEELSGLTDREQLEPQLSIHPFILARSWQQELNDDTKLTKAKIAIREGISRARVTQLMNLLQLPSEIQSCLLNPPRPLGIHSFSERSLRALVSHKNEIIQVSRWRKLVDELRQAGGN